MRIAKDILFVAWLEAVKGVSFKKYTITDSRRKIGQFEYDLDEDVWKAYKDEFYNSETTKTRYGVQRIKDLLNQ